MMSAAKKAVANVEDTVHFLESADGKALTKEARGAKVMGAVKQLQDLQTEWQNASVAKSADKMAELKKELEEKQAMLAKDMKMMKVLNLQKSLAEKKLKLQKLIEAKQEQQSHKDDAKAVAAREEMIANVLKLAKDVKSTKGTKTSRAQAAMNTAEKNPKLLGQVSTYLDGRMKTLSGSMADIDTSMKKREDEIKATLAEVGSKADAAEMKKSKAMLDMLVKKERRQYKKMRAGLQNEYNELDNAMKSIKKGDVAGLSKVMTHMQREMKTLQAKSQKFLY